MTTKTHLKELALLKDFALEALEKTASELELEQWRILHMGRRGQLTKILRSLQTLSDNDRRTVGAAANQVKKLLEDSMQQRSQNLKETRATQSVERDRIDVTIPGVPLSLGRLHPTTQTIRQICGAFSTMGFQIMEGPEVEWDYYNFEALNIPQDHPARDMWDTLWIDWMNSNGNLTMLLRTHTSPMQARIMESQQPPIRVVVPGKVYRYEATDATHESQFHQIEGLAVDENLTFADLKGVLYEFARRIFGQERRARFRCDYFPFVEPGVEMAIDCFLCKGQGCRVCSGTGWIEIMGAGMVHPRVLENVGYDPERYTGFAFGIGAERVAMLKYGISDMRLFHANDLRFLKQF
jgi:phenylalanyl-tRNA synthetase alpha chain